MVNRRKKLLSKIITSFAVLALTGGLLAGCSGSGSGSGSGGSNGGSGGNAPGTSSGTDSGTSSGTAEGGSDGSRSMPEPDEQDQNVKTIQGPDIPPDGMRYDEWKGFTYSQDTSFKVRTYWTIAMYDHSSPEKHGLFQDPVDIEDGVLEITDAKSEPVGGEMKLRSGGYVDINVELRWTGTMNGYEDYGASDHDYEPWLIRWQDTAAYPCDAYTGTSLLNYMYGDSDSEDTDMSPGQAVASTMVESSVTWGERTYRLFAKSDTRNASSSDWTEREEGSRYYFSCPGTVETTLTFRIPADYDGLVLAIDKDITDEKSYSLDKGGEFVYYDDMYADILTTGNGNKQTADDFYFVRVSDLLEHFDSERAGE